MSTPNIDSILSALQLLPIIRLRTREEVAHLLHITFPILPVGHVATTKGHPPDLRDTLKPRIHAEIGNLVILAIDEQGLNLNVVCLLPALPTLDRTNYDELCRPLTVRKYTLDICGCVF